ncbi:MAG: hypothetical protein IKM15_04790 [Peptococcaceae bacterium]|nr:hypothetical protein [Peptococcaceae bacterium]
MFIGQPGKNQASIIINGYQYPNNHENYYEANWLNMTLTLKTPEYQWSTTAPAMLACEMYRFIDWLQAIAENRATSNFFDCEEPMIYFSLDEVTDFGYIFTFHLSLDFNPPQNNNHETAFTMEIDKEQWQEWIIELKSYAVKCPVNYIIN